MNEWVLEATDSMLGARQGHPLPRVTHRKLVADSRLNLDTHSQSGPLCISGPPHTGKRSLHPETLSRGSCCQTLLSPPGVCFFCLFFCSLSEKSDLNAESQAISS